MSKLIPNYLNIDFQTVVNRLRKQIRESSEINDVDYEGSNINILIELFAYFVELDVYYANKLAKNMYMDTVDIYENAHRLAKQVGYNPKGYISSSGTIDVTIAQENIGDEELYIQNWSQFQTTDETDDDGNVIYFLNTQEWKGEKVGDNSIIFKNVPIKQGESITLNYSGGDISNYIITLPSYNFAYDDDIKGDNNTIRLFVDDEEWVRIENFYDDITGLTNDDKIFRFLYNKYGEYLIEFSPFREIPPEESNIEIWLLRSIGRQGNVKSNAINNYVSSDFIVDDEGNPINIDDLDHLEIKNDSVTYGGSEPETITDIKENSPRLAYTQFRNVTRSDYKIYLETSSLVKKAVVWGEKEENPDGGNVFDYNRIFVSVLPAGEKEEDWSTRLELNDLTDEEKYYEPSRYEDDFRNEVWRFLEPYKMIGTHEKFILPEFIYFKFNISLRIKPNYRFSDVREDFINKFKYYFYVGNRDFGETLSFTDIINKMEDQTFIDSQNDHEFSNTKGINNIIIRDIKFFDPSDQQWKYPYDDGSDDYPQYAGNAESETLNQIDDIKLKLNQFPFLNTDDLILEQIR